MKKILLALLICAINYGSFAQEVERPEFNPGEVYMQLTPESYKTLVDEAGNVNRSLFLETFQSVITPEELGFLTAPFYRAANSPIQHVLMLSIVPVELTDQKIVAFDNHVSSVYAEPIPAAYTAYTPNDLGSNALDQQWHLYRIKAKEAWDISKGDKLIKVAIVDDAMLVSHPDLINNVWVNPGEIPGDGIDNDGNGYIDDVNGYDVGDNDSDPSPPSNALLHGTHVGGISGATTDNSLGIASIGFDISLIAVRSHRTGTANTSISRGYNGIYYAAKAGADIINCSWSGSGFSTTNSNIIKFAQDEGCIVLAAMGNDGQQLTRYPAAYTDVISVAATTNSDTKATFSNYANYTTISAPGITMLSTITGNGYKSESGTSMATPLVAGLMGLMKSHYPKIDNADLIGCLLQTAVNIDAQNGSYLGKLGEGRVDAEAALTCVDALKQDAKPFVYLGEGTPKLSCVSTAINFEAKSIGGDFDSVVWNFPGGIPATSTDPNPEVVYSALGNYGYSCTMYNQNGSHTDSFPGGVVISSNGEAEVAFFGFNKGLAASGWIQDQQNPAIEWLDDVQVFGQDSIKGIHLSAFGKGLNGVKTTLTSPVMDWRDYGAVQMSFNMAAAAKNFAAQDSIIVLISEDAGTSFNETYRGNLSTDLNVSGISQAAFQPNSPYNWCNKLGSCLKLDLRALNRDSAVVIRIVHISHEDGNDLYLDEIIFVGNCAKYNTLPPAPQIIALTKTGCDSLLVEFKDNSDNFPSTYAWSFPGGVPSTSSEPFPTVKYATLGKFDVALLVSNENGSQQLNFTDYITINESPTVSIAASDTFTCKGTPITLTASGGNSWEWSPFLAISSATAKTITANPPSDLTYSVKGTNGFGCTSTATIDINVLAAPSAPQIFQNNGDLVLFPSNQADVDYEWYLNGELLEDEKSESITPWRSGQYSVRLTNTKTGCTDTSLYPFQFVSTGIKDLNAQLEFFPNPSSGKVFLKLGSAQSADIIIWSSDGRKVYSTTAKLTHGRWLNLSEQAPGVYVIQIQVGSEVIRKKLLIQSQ